MRSIALAVLLLLAPLAATAADPNDPGKRIYDKNCAQCHGVTGDGKGEAAPHVLPKPRDFTAGKFKIRTTPNGALPTDDDLKNIIRRGMPYTSMPGWAFTEPDLAALVTYVKSLHPGFADASRERNPEALPAAPVAAADAVSKGAKHYESLGCANCHGEAGRGDGPSAMTLKDDAGHPIRAANLAQRWTFRGGPTREDIFRTLTTGLNGTPMPSFKDALEPAQRWELTDFIASLSPGEAPPYGQLIQAFAVDEEIDPTNAATLFDKASGVMFPVVGQIMEPGRAFHPAATAVVVKAIYDQQKIAFLVSWDDTRADQDGKNAPDLAVPVEEEDAETGAAPAPATGDDPWGGEVEPEPTAPADDPWGEGEPAAAGGPKGEFSDAVAIQLPLQPLQGATKPYFIFGDGSNPVDLWFLDMAGAANRMRQLVGRGSAGLTPLESSEVEGTATYSKGTWSAVFVRDLRSTTGITFSEDQFVPIAFSVWDGSARERGNRRGLTQWFYVYLPPRERPSPIIPMVVAGVGVLVLEILVVVAMRRRRARSQVPAV